MRMNITANSFVFGRIYRENTPRTFYTHRKAKTSTFRLNFTANNLIFGRKIVNMRPEPFLQNLQAKNFQNPSELRGK